MKFLVAMAHVLWFLLAPALVIVSHLALPLAAAVSDKAPLLVTAPPPGCPSKCGEIDIPYPFGVNDDYCSWQGLYTINCSHSFSPPRPYWGNIEITSIMVETSEMSVYTPVSYICYNSSDTTQSVGEAWSLDLTDAPALLISSTRNVFTAIGCNTLALLKGRQNWSYFSGCITYCTSLDDAAADGDECTGLGCCQTHIPGNLSKIAVNWNNGISTTNPAWGYSPCSYAFVADKEWYKFSRQDITRNGNESFISRVGERTIPMVLDWAIIDGSCPLPPEAGGKPTAPACASANSYCVNATQGHGYLCNCSEGYQGNAYITGGCTDINECELRKLSAKNEELYPCGSHTTCQNIAGSYECNCKFGNKGVGKSRRGCQPIFSALEIGIAVAFVIVILASLAVVLHMKRKQRKRFNKNGGDILKGVGINLFTEGELKTITRGYSNRIGYGYFGEVFMGTINGAEAQQVAVKCIKAKKMARLWKKMFPHGASSEDGFVKEITFQFQIKHPNVVRLVGCCLETDVPRLVLEFIPNGSLEDVLHDAQRQRALSLPKRLDIAIGSAEALSYMHTHGEHNHVHGDVKPANILLDEELKPKVSDFGSSKILSVNRYAMAVAADNTYIDPMYVKTKRFTVKSDVYSFGVVLLELITRRTPWYGSGNILTVDFEKSFKEKGSGREMYDTEICSGDDAQSRCYIECLDMVGALAVRCLSADRDDRPTMAEVVEELKQVKAKAFEASSVVMN